VQLADEAHKATRRAFVDALLQEVPIEPYDLEVARAHAELLAYARRTGRPRGAHDLLIAATAQARARIVVSADASGFDDLPQVTVRSVPRPR
jgi:tRNA(fMet)-specific endonuclease VapC